MRFVDDFLLVSSDKELARQFQCHMSAGVPAYNCTVNAHKGGANFKVEAEGGEVVLDESGKCVYIIGQFSSLCEF